MTDDRYVVGWIGRLSFSFAVVLLAKSGLNYYRDSKTIVTRCEIFKHHVRPSFCLYRWTSFSGILGVCHVVHEWTKADGETTTWCQVRLMSPCYSSLDQAWEDLAKDPIGTIYPCYYQSDDSKYTFDHRYQWEIPFRIGAFLFFVSMISFVLVVTSKSYAKAKVE